MKIINSFYDLGADFYKEQKPQKVKNPELIIYNNQLAKSLNFLLDSQNNNIAEILSGNLLLKKSKPISLAYAGHQFGHFVDQLGDGRAILIAEIKDKYGQIFDMQLKGSGKTFFSRNGDGRCPLDAALKEYLISEAMFYLKIKTTRSLAVVKSNNMIIRDNLIPASIITRIAKSHIRIGTFEYFAARGDIKNIKILADYAINRHFPKYNNNPKKYSLLLREVIKLQIELIASWMSIGFIHGVMNTDNILISGQTIDYGPCAFMDEYNSRQVFSFIDKRGRYNYINQKNIILWNLTKFAQSILPILDDNIDKSVQIAEEQLNKFPILFEKKYYQKMAAKIGIYDYDDSLVDKKIVNDFLEILEEDKIDFTNGFRNLSKILLNRQKFYNLENKHNYTWYMNWLSRLKKNNNDFELVAKKLNNKNPILIPRNHVIVKIIKEVVENNNYDLLNKFLIAIKNPFIEKNQYSQFYKIANEKEKVINTFCGT